MDRRNYQSPFRYKTTEGEMRYYTKENAHLMPRLLLLTSIRPHEILSTLLQYMDVIKQQQPASNGHVGDDSLKAKQLRARMNLKGGDPDSPSSDLGSFATPNVRARPINTNMGIGSPTANSSSSSIDVSLDMTGSYGGNQLTPMNSDRKHHQSKSRSGSSSIPNHKRRFSYSPRTELNNSKLSLDSSANMTPVRPAMPLSSSSLTSPHRKAAIKNNRQ
jgi:hypothetical protein